MYTITNLINEYNSAGAKMLANTVLKQNGLIAYGAYNLANKQLAHTYTRYDTLPTAGIRSLGDGVASSTVSGSTSTLNLTLFDVNGAWDKAFVGTDLVNFFNTQAPLYFNSVAQKAENAMYYTGSGYTGTCLHSYVKTNSTTQCLQTTSSATACTSIFAVRFAPVENLDGAAIVVDPLTNSGLFTVNDNWTDVIELTGTTGPFQGHAMHFGFNGTLLLPGTDNAAAITGIKSGSLPTEQMIDEMLDMVKADSNTIILCNLKGKGILNRLGKSGALIMQPNEMGYSNQIATWNGIPIVIDENITNAETGVTYQLT